MTLIAKPVVDKQFWILQDGNQKVGNIEACAGGYQVKLHNQVSQFKTIKMAARQVNIKFEPAMQIPKINSAAKDVHGYPVTSRVYNPVWNVSQQLPVYTKSAKSKSWYTAGWYRVRKGKTWQTVFCPKLIVIQRYAYQGPFHSEDQANDCAFTKVC